jgi:ribose-phosphate pyrophosphokinase
MELALLADAIHHLCPFVRSTLILPYLPYSRADRRFQEGDCNGLQVFGEHLGALRFNQIKTLDVHSFRAAKHVPNLVDISARSFIDQTIEDLGNNDLAVLLPDEGAKRHIVKGIHDVVQCSKKRDPKTGALSGFEVPEFTQSRALIVDDICDGGGTFVGLAQEIQKTAGIQCRAKNCAGTFDARFHHPKKLYLYVTHGLFSKGLAMLNEHFECIYTTDSWTNQRLHPIPKLKVYSCEKLLLEGLV